jgi:peptide/nickel transport system substrate-binding protein
MKGEGTMKENRRLFVMVLLLATLPMIHVSSTGAMAASPQGTMKQVIHQTLSADWLDPATSTNAKQAFEVLYLFHDGLVKTTPSGLFTPSLAESWNISPDAKVYEFKLRAGVKFHNGDVVTAEDVVFSFQRYKSAHAKLIRDRIEKMEAASPHLFRIRFKEPFPDFLEYLAAGATSIACVVPKKYVEKMGDAGYKRQPIGCGPYRFVEFETGVKVVGEAFEGYWRKVPQVKRMEILIVLEGSTRLAMAMRGEVDLASSVQTVLPKGEKRDPKLRIVPFQSSTVWMIQMTNQFDPKSPWADVRVRRAASLALDRQSLVDVHWPGAVPAGTIGTEDDPFVANIPADPYDPERARKLLAEAGYPNGFHGGTFYPYNGAFAPYSEQIINYWKAVGITVDSKLMDRAAVLAYQASGKMKGATFVQPSSPPTVGMRLSYLFHDTSYGNYPDILALWDQFNRAFDPKHRKDLIGRVQKLVSEKVMYLPLNSSSTLWAVGPRVKEGPWRKERVLGFPCPFEDMELVE